MSQDQEHLIISPSDPINEVNDGDSENQNTDGSSRTQAKMLPQYVATIGATTSALASGAVLGWTSPITQDLLEGKFNSIPVNEHQMGWIGSIAVFGALLSGLVTGKVCDRIGRKTTLLCLSVPFGVGWALIICSQSIEILILGRFLTGIAVGSTSIAGPMYINEIAQPQNRGKLGSYFQLMITVGVLYSYIFGKILSIPYYTLSCALIPAFFLIIFIFPPETPAYYLSLNEYDQAVKAMKLLRGSDYYYLDEIRDLTMYGFEPTISLYTYIFELKRYVVFLLPICLMFFQQICGINAIIFYTSNIFEAAHVNLDPKVSAIIIAAIQVVATFISSLLVDKTGRKVLLIYSLLAMAAACFLLGMFFSLNLYDPRIAKSIGFLPVGSLSLYIIAFSMGMGPIPWIIPNEMFQRDIKGAATSVAGSVNWGLAFLITKFFLDVELLIGQDILFYFFGVMCIVGLLFVYFKLPETKGKTPEEILREL